MIELKYDNNGHVIHNGNHYNAIKKLATLLDEAGIPYEMIEFWDGYQINAYEEGVRIGDVVQHYGSYGAKQDLIEAYGFGIDGVDGYLSAEEALQYFLNWHKRRKEGE